MKTNGYRFVLAKIGIIHVKALSIPSKLLSILNRGRKKFSVPLVVVAHFSSVSSDGIFIPSDGIFIPSDRIFFRPAEFFFCPTDYFSVSV